jgi:hypothetical protein
MSETKPKRYQCRHIFTDGHRCGSICLRGEEFCYYHHTTRKPAQKPRARRSRQSTFDLPITDPNDRTGLQSTIVEVLRRIASNDIDPRRAGLLLYGLQIASLNLPKPQIVQRGRKTEESETVEEITTHPELGVLAPVADIDEIQIRPGSAFDLLLKEMAPKRTNTTTESEPTPQPTTLPTIQATADTTDAPLGGWATHKKVSMHRVPHLRDSFIVAKVGHRAKRDPFSSLSATIRHNGCDSYFRVIRHSITIRSFPLSSIAK